ncbi:MAG: hypothetical protein H0V16_02525 [Burkholderiaceae bacterium]|nr:hypothetical protein [Burkholderiaceae bacterium]
MNTRNCKRLLLGLLLLPCIGQAQIEATESTEPTLLQVMQSSAVPPIGRALLPRRVTNVIPGNFEGNGKQEVLIRDDNVVFCKDAGRKHCNALGQLATKRTMGVDVKGKTVLLQVDSPTLMQACTVTTGFRAGLDCRAVNVNKLSDYGVLAAPDGRSVLVSAVDGKYLCVAEPSSVCMMILDAAGNPPQPKKRAVKKPWEMRPAALFYELDEVDFTGIVASWGDYITGEYMRDCGYDLCDNNNWYTSRWDLNPPPMPRRDCLDLCDEQRDMMLSVCAGFAGAACIGGAFVGGPAGCLSAGGATGLACLGGGGVGDVICRLKCPS